LPTPDPEPNASGAPLPPTVRQPAATGEPAATREPAATGEPDDDAIALEKGRALDFVAGPVWHELANSLGAIKAFATMLRLDPGLPADLAGDAALLVEAADTTRRLARTYLEVSRTRPSAPRAVRAATMAAEVHDLTAYLLTDVDTRIDVPDTLPDIEVDPSGFRLALLIVVLDAIRALGGNRARGWLVVSGGRANGGRGLELVVEDSAAPVRDADRGGLFDPARGPGTGRGGRDLAVARTLLRRAGGDLRHETTPGGANRLILSVASAGPTATPTSEASPGTAAPAVISVLVCDDEDAIRGLISRVLERRGMRVVQAASGKEALDALSDQALSVVIADQRMVGMTGTDLYLAMVARRPGLRSRFILMTGDAGEPGVVALSRSEGFPILPKPFELAALSAAIAQVIEGADG